MSEVLLSLGPFQFYASAPSFEKLRFLADFRWVPQERLGRDPAMQFLGPGERQVTLDGTIYPEAFGGEELLPAMQQAARQGAVFPLLAMSDAGLSADVMGLWIIKKIENTRSFFGAAVGARKIEFNIELRAYGEDGVLGGRLF